MELLADHLEQRGYTTRDNDGFLFATPDGEHLDYSNWLHRIWYRPARRPESLGLTSITSAVPTPPGSSWMAST